MKALPPMSSRVQLPAWLSHARRTADRHWLRLAPREKRLLVAGAAVVAASVVWLVLLEPALDTTQRLHRTLPELRAQAAQLDAIINETHALQRAAPTQGSAPNRAELQLALIDSLQRNALANAEHVQNVAPDEWTIIIENAAADAWLTWLQMAPLELRLIPVQLDIQAATDAEGRALPGLVTGAIRLARSDMEPS